MTKRIFTGDRTQTGRIGTAGQLKKLEMQKGGRVGHTSTDRYKKIMQEKLNEQRKALESRSQVVLIPGAKPFVKEISKNARMALQQIAQRKAVKDAKAMRRMVVIQPRNYPDAGYLDKHGRVYDLAGGQVLKVNRKNGKIQTMTGWTVGKYKPKSLWVNQLIVDNIKKHSPYFIRMRQLQLLQQQQAMGVSGGGVYGMPVIMANVHGQMMDAHGNTVDANGIPMTVAQAVEQMDMYQRVGANVNAWGAMSNNVHGTFAENVHGTMMDNVWGTNYSNVWGGIGGGTGWGNNVGWKIWGSGQPNQKNYLAPLGKLIAGLFGLRGFGGRNGRNGGGSSRVRMGGGRR